LHDIILEEWAKADFPLEALRVACLRADATLVAPPEGFFAAFGERGVGGSKCGSTAAIVALYEEGGSTRLCTANVGDARILLVRDGKAVQLSVDHVPDDEAERKRIDRGNPNLRKSLVTFTEGSWRVGGVLALSRAFGDSFLKESGRFEGIGEKNADYGSGFGLNAEPDCYIEQITPADSWVLLSSDGLFENPERGGGGGWTNQELADYLLAAPADKDPETLAKELIEQAVAKGSTDDVTVQLLRL
jgi:serine/threonine protein phosphatase PrpC